MPHAGGDRTELKTEMVDNDDRVGLVALAPANGELPEVFEATRQYGVYGDMLLTYYAKHIRAKSNDQLAAAGPSKELKLDIVPKATNDGLELTVLWDGKPKADADVAIKVDGENEEAEAEKFKTDAEGKVTLQPEGAGLVAVLANISDTTQKGEFKGKKYAQAAEYASLTFPWQATEVKTSSTVPAKMSKPEKSATASKKKNAKSTSGLPAVAGCGLQFRCGCLRRLPIRLQRPHRHGACPLGRESLPAFPARCARRREAVGRTADADAAARAGGGGPRRQDLSRRRDERPQQDDRRQGRLTLDG